MSEVKQKLDLKIKEIVEKLQNLDCPLLGSKEDAWVLELLFSPGVNRYDLIEWILSKFQFDVGKMPGPQNSVEERQKNLQSITSDLGICRKNSHDIIGGTASMKEQLQFWCTLVDNLWLQHEVIENTSMTESDEGIGLSIEKNKCIKSVDEEHERAVSVINSICTNVNIKHLFQHEIPLLAPDVESEIKKRSPPKSEMYAIPTLKDVINVKQPTADSSEQYKSLLLLSKLSVDDNEDNAVLNAELNQLEEQLHNLSFDFQEGAQQFSHTYNDLKSLILQVKKDESFDIGEYFGKLESNLENFCQLAKSFPKLKSSNLEIPEVNSELEDLLNQEELSDPMYLNALKLTKDETY